MQITVSPWFGVAVLETVLYSFVLQWMAIKTGMARRKYGVKYPAAYENKDDSVFNRYQRAHQNAVEQATSFYAALLLAALHQPLPAVVAGLVYIVGRIIYCVNYYVNVNSRRNGMFFSTFIRFNLFLFR